MIEQFLVDRGYNRLALLAATLLSVKLIPTITSYSTFEF